MQQEPRHPWDRRLGVWYLAEDHPGATAVSAAPSGGPFTYAELTGRAHQVVHALRAAGLGYGDAVALALPNDIDIVVWQLACQEGGWRYISLNPALSAAEIQAIMAHSGAAAVVVHAGYADRTADIVSAGSVCLRLSIGGDIAGFEPAAEVLAGHPTTTPADRRAGVAFAYTSGTTGTPKGIRRPMPDVDPSVMADLAKTFGHAFRFRPLDGVHLVSAGMHHGGCQSFYHGALNVGQALVVMGKFEAEETLRLIEQHRVTTAYMVPTQFVRLLRLPAEVRTRYDVSSLEVVVHSAAPCPVEVKKQMLEWWGPVIWETYGGIEGAATIAKPHRWLEKPGTVGRAVRGMNVMVLDDDGNQVAAGELGTVYMQSDLPATFSYHNDDAATASVHRGKAFTIGDIGYLDDDGYLFLRDRAKDMVITGGVNVYPAEVEGVLAAHQAVQDVAVIGIPDDEWGEQIKAVVQVSDGIEPSEQLAADLIAFCHEQLAGFKCPRSVDFRDELPRTDSGKLYKRRLRDEYWEAAGRKV